MKVVKTAPFRAKPQPPMKFYTMDTVEEREMHWLWSPYIPMGAISMIFGPGGVGKSHLTCALAAAISNGSPLPGQTGQRPPQRVLMLNAEDEPDVVLKPRLRKLGANESNILVPSRPFILSESGIEQISDVMRNCAATVGFIDPVVSWVGSRVDINRANEVREILGALSSVAKEAGTAIILVHHSRKGSEGDDWEKMMGSVDFTNAVRSVLFCTIDADGNKILRHVKSNYAKLGPSWGYSFDDNDAFVWGESYEEKFIPKSSRRTISQRAREFLREVLANGPLPSAEVRQMAEDRGINYATLQFAKKGLVGSRATRVNGVLTWHMYLLEEDELQ